MGYENLYEELNPLEKDLKDVANKIMRMYKSIAKDTEGGNLRNISKSLEILKESVGELEQRTKAIEDCVDSFDEGTYFESGNFAQEMVSCCKEAGIDVIGQSPVYEMFPYRVRIDAENREVYLDRKKMNTMRPLAVAETVSKNQDKIQKSNFNAVRFAEELSEAYDLTILRMKKRSNADILLDNIYKTLVPMARFKKDYDKYNFAYDIARLYGSDIEATKKGRRWQFGHSHEIKNAIRILDAEGNEQFLATIKFFDAEE